MQLLRHSLAAAGLSAALMAGTVWGSPSPNPVSNPPPPPPPAPRADEALHMRDYFYVGGEYVAGPTGHFFHNQLYVEKLSTSVKGKQKQPYPIVFLHGGGQCGTNFLNKPDGGRGWASWFLEKGYDVYIVDRTMTARSPILPADNFTQTAFTAEFIAQRFTAVQKYPKWPTAKLHTQWPGTGEIGDPIFDTYYKSNVASLSNSLEQEVTMQAAGEALLDTIGDAVVVTHSQGGLYGWSWADSRPKQIKALIQLEPKGPPFSEVIFSTDFSRAWGLTSIPLTYSPMPPRDAAKPLAYTTVPAPKPGKGESELLPCMLQAEPARKLPKLAQVPILIGTSEASYHAQYDYCFVKFLKQAGVKADHLELGKEGIHGNAHLMFMEKNSDDVANALHKWIVKKVKGRP